MKRPLLVIALLGAFGCAGTQSSSAFTPKHSPPDFGTPKPNHAKQDDARLRKSIDDAIERQELLDEVRSGAH